MRLGAVKIQISALFYKVRQLLACLHIYQGTTHEGNLPKAWHLPWRRTTHDDDMESWVTKRVRDDRRSHMMENHHRSLHSPQSSSSSTKQLILAVHIYS
jgi:hypothetical protein